MSFAHMVLINLIVEISWYYIKVISLNGGHYLVSLTKFAFIYTVNRNVDNKLRNQSVLIWNCNTLEK